MQIGKRSISRDDPPFIIAEMSGNHNQSLERALRIVEAAAEAGVDAIKLQTYTPDTMTLDLSEGEFLINDPESLWHGSTLYNLYEQAHTPWDWHPIIFQRAKELGLLAFSTAFDETSVDFLEGLNVPCYKVASFEIVHLPLIQKIAKTGKPIIISTGMATVAEIGEAVQTVFQAGCEDLILLKCTSTYPAKPENSKLKTLTHLQEMFACQVGLSDHTPGIGAAVASIALGAVAIEKHFTLSREDGGVDAAFSLEPGEMEALVQETHRAWRSLGAINYGPTAKEEKAVFRRRSIYVTEDLQTGDVLSEKNCRVIRPGLGLAPKYYTDVLGLKVSRSVSRGTPLSWDLLKYNE